MQLGGLLRRGLLSCGASSGARRRYGGFVLQRSFCQQAATLDEDESEPRGPFDGQIVDESHPNFATLWDKMKDDGDNVSVIKKWKEEGNELPKDLVNNIVRKMCARRWYSNAQKVTDWLDNEKPYETTDDDMIIRLEINSRFRFRLNAAQECFDKLSKKSEAAYLILLRSRCTRLKMAEAEKLFAELVESKLMTSSRGYAIMLRMYGKAEKPAKAAEIFKKFKESGFTAGAEVCLVLLEYKDMFSKLIPVDEFVEAEMENIEVNSKNRREALRMYGLLKSSEGLDRVWKSIVASPPVVLSEYVAAISGYDEAGNVEKALELSKEMVGITEGAYPAEYSLVMLRVYSKHGLMDLAEELMKKMEGFNKLGNFYHCHLLIEGYLKLGKVEEAMDWFKKFVARGKEVRYPIGQVVACKRLLLETFVESKDVKRAEKVIALIPEMHNTRVHNLLMKVYLAAGTPMYGVEERLAADNVNRNKETKELLAELKKLEV